MLPVRSPHAAQARPGRDAPLPALRALHGVVPDHGGVPPPLEPALASHARPALADRLSARGAIG
ncbi:MAG: hypothetical protein ACXV0U_02395 [Kineosporiaceae bacterium]